MSKTSHKLGTGGKLGKEKIMEKLAGDHPRRPARIGKMPLTRQRTGMDGENVSPDVPFCTGRTKVLSQNVSLL